MRTWVELPGVGGLGKPESRSPVGGVAPGLTSPWPEGAMPGTRCFKRTPVKMFEFLLKLKDRKTP